jgi:hypothetical protein
MLPEFFSAVYHYNPDVYRSLFHSAGATIAAWRAVRTASQAFTTSPTTCTTASGQQPDGSSGDDASSDAGPEAAPLEAGGSDP